MLNYVWLSNQQNSFDENDFQFVVPVGNEISERLNRPGLQNNLNSHNYKIALDESNHEYHGDFVSKSFTFFIQRLNKGYSRGTTNLYHFDYAINKSMKTQKIVSFCNLEHK